MTKIQTIIFDLGNVLIDVDREKWIDVYNSILPGLGTKYFEIFNRNIDVLIDYEKGLISDDEYADINIEWLENKIDRETFKHNFTNIFTLYNDVIDLLPKIKKDYKLCLLSNTSNIHKEYGWGNYGFIKYFDHLFLSNELHLFKPDREIYLTVEKRLGNKPEEILFIDDLEKNVSAAKELGWDTIQFKNYENLLVELNNRKIL